MLIVFDHEFSYSTWYDSEV